MEDIIDRKFVAMFEFLEQMGHQDMPWYIRYLVRGEMEIISQDEFEHDLVENWGWGGELSNLIAKRAVSENDFEVMQRFVLMEKLRVVLYEALVQRNWGVIEWVLRVHRDRFIDEVGFAMLYYDNISTLEGGTLSLEEFERYVRLYFGGKILRFSDMDHELTKVVNGWLMHMRDIGPKVFGYFNILWKIIRPHFKDPIFREYQMVEFMVLMSRTQDFRKHLVAILDNFDKMGFDLTNDKFLEMVRGWNWLEGEKYFDDILNKSDNKHIN